MSQNRLVVSAGSRRTVVGGLLAAIALVAVFAPIGNGGAVGAATTKKAAKKTVRKTIRKTVAKTVPKTVASVVTSAPNSTLIATTVANAAAPSTVAGAANVSTIPTAAVGTTLLGANPAAGSTVSTLVWTPCGTFECATLDVPRSYDNLVGPKISIGLQRAKATGPNPAGSVLINPGGPSGSGIDFLTNRPKLFTPAAREQFHIIGFDPRGIGRSTALSCASTRDRDSRTSKQYIDAVRDACYNRQPDLLPTITTANTARDMEQIRIALGEPKLNYLGVSYGTYLGLVYADLFPDRVGRFMIDSAVDPALRAIELTAGQYAVYEARVVNFMSRCAGNRTCTFGPNSLTRYEALLAKLQTTPLRDGAFVLDRATLESATFALVRQGLETTLARLLLEFERGNAAAVTELARLFDSGIPNVNDLVNDADGDGMYYQVACYEGFHSSASKDSPAAKFAILTAKAPHYSASAANLSGTQACVYWGNQTDTRPQPVAKPGVPPILFFGSINDNVTPAIGTRKVAGQWSGSVYVEIAGAAHGVMSNNTCANDAGSVFLLTGRLPLPTACG